MRFDPGKGGRLVESYDDGDEHELGRILCWDARRRLVFEWRGVNFQRDQVTEVEVRFEATDTGTRVVIEHRGWDRLPLDHPARHKLPSARFIRMLSRMWADQLVAAKHHVERAS